MPLLRDLFDHADALLPQRVSKNAEHLRAAARLGDAHAALGDAHARQPRRGGFVGAGPRDRLAQPIDGGLIEPVRDRHRHPGAVAQLPRRVLLLGSDCSLRQCRAPTRFRGPRRDAVVFDGDADPHRLLARVLLRDLRRQSRHASDHEQQLRRRRRKPQVVQHAGERAVDVDRQRLDRRGRGGLDCANRRDAIAGDVPLPGHREQDVHPRILRVLAMPEPWHASTRGADRFDLRARRLGEPPPRRARSTTRPMRVHAGFAGAAVFVADRQHAGRHRG